MRGIEMELWSLLCFHPESHSNTASGSGDHHRTILCWENDFGPGPVEGVPNTADSH